MRLLVFAGTSEGRRLAEILSDNHIPATVSVATDYGELTMPDLPGITVRKGRMDKLGMVEFIRSGRFDTIVDATHPYARAVSVNIRSASKESGTEYLRLVRNTTPGVGQDEGIYQFSTAESAAEALKLTKGNILLTTGSKDISVYAKNESLRKRLFVRILPDISGMTACEEAGIKGKQIIAMQGPFSLEMNRATLLHYDIKTLVTKESGKNGGFDEKIAAAAELGVGVFVVTHEVEEGLGFSEVLEKLSEISGKNIVTGSHIDISLVGVGMGSEGCLTLEAKNAIDKADIIYGAERLINTFGRGKRTYPYYMAKDILPHLESVLDERTEDSLSAAVLYSGDTGLCSGAGSMRESLLDWKEKIHETVEIHEVPGISSFSYFAAKLSESWGDAELISIHGKDFRKEKNRIRKSIGENGKTFILVSGKKDVEALYKLVEDMDTGKLAFAAGYNLSAPDEKIFYDTDEELPEGLYTVFIKNSAAAGAINDTGIKYTGIRNRDLIRDEKTPATKEEVRKIVLGKLELKKDSVFYDIGAGTGSISVDAALCVPSMSVYSFEKEKDRVALVGKNLKKFGISNVKIIEGRVPESLAEVKKFPTHAFIGGSDGKLSDILTGLRDRIVLENMKLKKEKEEKKASIRVVITAVTLDKRAELMELRKKSFITDYELIETGISRSEPLGKEEFMKAENPVAVCSFTLV